MAKTKKTRITLSAGDRMFDIINGIFIAFILTIVIYPLIYILSASFSSATAVVAGRVILWPVDFSLEGYTAVFENKQVVTGYYNSLIYTVLGTIVNIVITFMAAYPLARKDELVGANVFSFIFVFTMLFSGGLIPSYLLVSQLGMLDTRWAMIIPGALSVWNLIITRTFIQTTIPRELYEAAEIEGAGDFTILFKIVLPLSGTIIAVNALFYAMGHWNAYFNALIYLKSADLFPLQITLRNILIINQVDYSAMMDEEDLMKRQAMKELLKFSLIVVSTVPALVIYPFIQKFFVKGVMIGSLKG